MLELLQSRGWTVLSISDTLIRTLEPQTRRPHLFIGVKSVKTLAELLEGWEEHEH